MSEPLLFISPAIIDRIERGVFTPARRTSAHRTDDRRNRFSPLAITRRCIRYEPRVFGCRHAELLKILRALNAPAQRMILVGGGAGMGKTSLLRGVIEVMGGGGEQLLWFDINRHTDFEEIIQFLIRYITEIAHASIPEADIADNGEPPMQRLKKLMARIAHLPLLIVLDNVEYLVDAEWRFNSYPFKEMLNFLLGFPNVKMALVGERLPHADISPDAEGMAELRLDGLSEADGMALLLSEKPTDGESTAGESPQSRDVLRRLHQKTGGAPWLLKILLQLHHHGQVSFEALERLLEETDDASKDRGEESAPVAVLTRYIHHRLPELHRRIFRTLALIRHPVDAAGLRVLLSVLYPVLGATEADLRTLEDMLEHSLLRGLLKISYPPQEVLAHIRRRGQMTDAEGEKFRPSYELRHPVRKSLYEALPKEERERIHEALHGFYLREQGEKSRSAEKPGEKSAGKSALKLPTRALIAEAKYHQGQGRRRTSGIPPMVRSVGADSLELTGDFASRAYLSQGEAHPARPQDLTLSDYRNISLPEASPPAQSTPSPDTDPANPADPIESRFAAYLEKMANLPSIRERLASIEPVEETESPPTQVEPEPSQPDLQRWADEVWIEPTSAPEAGGKADTVSSEQKAEAEPARQPLSEAEKEIQQQLSDAVSRHDRPAMVRQLVELGRYRADLGRYESAAGCLEKALSMKEDAGKPLLAEIYRLAGRVYKATYRHNLALSFLTRAAEAIRALMYTDDTVNIAWLRNLGGVYQDLGEIYAYRGRYDDAANAFGQALRWYASVDEPARRAEVHFRLAGVHEERNESEAAMAEYHKALHLDETHGNPSSAAASLVNLGYLYRDEGRWEEASDCFRRALAYDRETGNTEGQFSTLDAMATINMLRENLSEAEILSREGLALAIRLGEPLWQASFYMRLGQIEEFNQNWDGALQHFRLALSSGDVDLSRESREWIQSKIIETEEIIS